VARRASVTFVRRRRASKTGCSPDRALGASSGNHIDDHGLAEQNDDVSGFLPTDNKPGKLPTVLLVDGRRYHLGAGPCLLEQP
jgi:hypothetical protein